MVSPLRNIVDQSKVEVEEITPPHVLPVPPCTRACNMPSVEGKVHAKKKAKKSLGSPSKPIADFLMAFVETYEGLEGTKLQMAREHMQLASILHAYRQAMEERHAQKVKT